MGPAATTRSHFMHNVGGEAGTGPEVRPNAMKGRDGLSDQVVNVVRRQMIALLDEESKQVRLEVQEEGVNF